MDLLSAIIGHLVGDYLLQFDYIAENKKKSKFVCLFHCLIWTSLVVSFGQVYNIWAITILFLTHYIQDSGTIIQKYMNFMGQKNFAKPPLAPWSVIVVDNVWHIVTIWACYKLFF